MMLVTVRRSSHRDRRAIERHEVTMDALALLCNLYGDGPATLRRLREAGCATFASLERIAPDDLAVILASSPVAARRFQREARLLLERAGEDAEGETFEETPDATETHDAVLERAISAWRELDSKSDATATATDDERDPRADRRRAAVESADRETPLRPDLFDGFDADTCAKLRVIGIESAEDLVACDGLDLASAVDLPFTRLIRFQALARRMLGIPSTTSIIPAPRAQDKRFSPDPMAGALREREEAESSSGPFA
jgi:hypothetical protein